MKRLGILIAPHSTPEEIAELRAENIHKFSAFVTRIQAEENCLSLSRLRFARWLVQQGKISG